MKRNSFLGAAAAAVVLVVALGVVLLREDPAKTGTARGGKGAPNPARWNLPPLKTEKPAAPTQRGKIDLPALPAAKDAITGFVKDARGAPLAGATVALLADEKCSARTGADGAFSLVPSITGRKLVVYATAAAPFAPRVVPGVAPGTSGLVIVLHPGDATLQGRVVRANDKKPVPNAKLEASTGDWLGRATTDESGRFTLAGAPSGAVGLLVSAENLLPRVVTVNAPRGTGPDVEIALEPGVKLEGTVVENEVPVANARVIMRQAGVPLPFERRETTTDPRGRFVFAALPPAEVRITARTDTSFSGEQIVRCDGAHDPEPLKVVLAPGGAIVGRVSCAGAPVTNARVTVLDDDAKLPLAGTTGADGRFSVQPCAEGTFYNLRVEAKGFARGKATGTTSDAVDVELKRAAILVVCVVPPAQEIEVEGADGERRILQWGGVIEDLEAGATWVVAKTPGRAPAARRVDLKEGETTRVDIDLKEGAPLEGTCTSDDGAPVVGASVVATDLASGPLAAGSSTTTDADGRFKLNDLAPGKHRVIAVASGFIEAQVEVAADSKNVALTLGRSYGLEVQVTIPPPRPKAHEEDHTHEQYGQILVRLDAKDGKEPSQQRVLSADGTRASGVFDRLRGQLYVVTVTSPSLAPVKAEIDPRTQRTAAFTLEPGAECTGIVVDADGNPIVGAAIARGRDPNEDLLHEGAFATLLAMTEEKGDFHCELAPGGEDVTVTHPDFAPLFAHLEPGKDRRLALAPGSRLVGRALSKDGAPQANIGVSLDGPVQKRTQTGADGSFQFKGLLPGTYHAKRHDSPPEAPGVEVSVGNRGETSVDLRAP